jgi:AraC family transcriptional regulator of arabinose operon
MPYWQLLVTTGGKALWDSPAGRLQLERGDLMLTRPGTPLFYEEAPPQRRWDCLYGVFQPYPHWMELLRWPEVAPGTMRLRIEDGRLFRAVAAAMRTVIAEERSRRRGQLRAMNALERVLLLCDEANHEDGRVRLDPRIQAAMDYMLSRQDRHVSVAELAQAVHMSPSRLAHLFRQQVGLSPLEYHDRGRMRRACRLLVATDMPIKRIGMDVGYPQPYHFSARFRRLIGQSPSEYRQRRMQ